MLRFYINLQNNVVFLNTHAFFKSSKVQRNRRKINASFRHSECSEESSDAHSVSVLFLAGFFAALRMTDYFLVLVISL